MRILGLDEAGRGSVLGPLVVGAFVAVADGESPPALEALAGRLRALGAGDSKALSAPRRHRARVALAAAGVEEAVEIEAREIDEGNVNDLELRAFAALARRHQPDRAYLDAPVNPAGIGRVVDRLRRESGVRDWIVEPKADARYPVVGAASIVAKTTRDARMEAISQVVKAEGGVVVGSGYPSDPETREFLAHILARGAAMPPFVRTRWGTLEVLRQGRLF
jgi:ribonuclease HII